MINKMIKFGLDFGTTNSSISVARDGEVEVLKIDLSALDPRVIRSMLFFEKREIEYNPRIPKARIMHQVFEPGDINYVGESKFLIGQAAVDKYLLDNKNRHEGIKRIMRTGRIIDAYTWQEVPAGAGAVREYYEEIDYGTGRLLQALKSSLKTSFKGTTIFGKFYTVEELISIFIGFIKEQAEAQIGEKIEEITIGRPVHFSDDLDIDRTAQERLHQALILTGLKKIHFEFEPIGAAKQFIKSTNSDEKTILVFDFGGGTLDIAIVKTGTNPKVLATDGVYIGGDLLNSDIMQAKLWPYFGSESTWGENKLPVPTHLYEALGSWYSIPTLNNPETLQLFERIEYKNSDPESLVRFKHLIRTNVGFEIYEAIEKAKKDLSTFSESKIIFQDGPIDLNINLTKSDFEQIIQSRVDVIRELVLKTLIDAKLKPEEIDLVIRTGGSSLIPVFVDMLDQIFGKEKISLFETFTSIASGLALD